MELAAQQVVEPDQFCGAESLKYQMGHGDAQAVELDIIAAAIALLGVTQNPAKNDPK